MKTRMVKSIFGIREDENIAGVTFKVSNKQIQWEDMTAKEQRKTLNAWAGMYELFYRFLKEED